MYYIILYCTIIVYCSTLYLSVVYYIILYYIVLQMRQKKLQLPFNETEWNGPFNETERAVLHPFEVRVYLPSVLNPF